ncbi:MAG: PorT family protein [Bacteroidales bacterium]|nr:PorT family protein [Bacteroidales bacterium]
MKKIVYLLLAVTMLTVSNNAEAQHRKRSHSRVFDLELRGGVNFCQIDGDAAGSYNKIGFHGGVNTSFPISDDGSFRFIVELGLTQKGSQINNSTLDRHINLFYVEVPLMLAYDFLEQKPLRLAAGIAPAILAKAKVTTDGSYDNLQSDNYKTLDPLPFCASLRYRFSEHIGVDVRYYNSMLNIAKENGSGTYRIFRSNKGQFSRLLQAGVTITF